LLLGFSAVMTVPCGIGPDGRDFLERLDLPQDAREQVTVALFMVDTLDRQIYEIERGLRRVARHQAGCQALMTQFGVDANDPLR
jgi:hypothetical protein